jgi:uncharacterized membrane protein YfcA
MITAWIGALMIGLSLGLLGSGGSVLTVPILVYLVGQHEKVAIAGSLAIVGGISLIGAIPYALQQRVDWKSVVFFGLPGMGGTYLGAYLARYVSGTVQLLLFAVMMVLAGVMMLRPHKFEGTSHQPQAYWQIALEGVAVGVVTGLVGVGGGFLIVPALVLLGGLPMPIAVGTSLLIIALKSFSGWYKYLHVLAVLGLRLDWKILGVFTVIGVIGGLVGNVIGTRLPQATLRRAFAYFLFAMGGVVLWHNLSRVLG